MVFELIKQLQDDVIVFLVEYGPAFAVDIKNEIPDLHENHKWLTTGLLFYMESVKKLDSRMVPMFDLEGLKLRGKKARLYYLFDDEKEAPNK